jgi:hypothetical protein
MQAYYEIEIQIPSNHQLNIQLPDTIPAGRAKIAVIYEVANLPTPANKKKLMADFLASLPDHPEGGLTVEEIQAYIDDERASAKILAGLGGTEPQLEASARRQPKIGLNNREI